MSRVQNFLPPLPRRIFSACVLLCAALGLSTLAVGQAGQLDSTFGVNGVFTPPASAITFALATSVAIQPDGKIVVAGGGHVPGEADGPEPVVMRLTAAGALDTTFGTDGVASIDLGGGGGIFATGVVVQSDGKIVIGIASSLADDEPSLQLIRFDANGTLDTTFGTGGRSLLFRGSDTAFLLQEPDGDLLLGGGMVIVGITADGIPVNVMPQVAPVVSAALQSNGEILAVSGLNFFPPPPAQIGLTPPSGGIVRYQANGTIDLSFGEFGRTASVLGTTAVQQQANGQIVTVGPIVSEAQVGGISTEFGVIRYNANGSVDFKFGSHGGALIGFGGASFAAPTSLAIDAKGNIIVAGQAQSGSGPASSSFALARLTSAGVLDATFGTEGTVVTPASVFGTAGATSSGIAAIALDSEGRLVVVGNIATTDTLGVIALGQPGGMAVARYLTE
jgi:uncharacterized delta-60 repeat protein